MLAQSPLRMIIIIVTHGEEITGNTGRERAFYQVRVLPDNSRK